MKTILIPIDSSEASANAVRYAAELSKDIPVKRIILLKSLYTSVYTQLLSSADFVQLNAENIDEDRQRTEEIIRTASLLLLDNCRPSVKIKTAVSELPLLRSIHQIIDDEQPDLLLTGSDHLSYLNASYIGTQLATIARTSPVPVLIIPAAVSYRQIRNALVPCNFSALSGQNLLKALRTVPGWLKPQLTVLNTDQEPKSADQEENAEALKELLENYRYKVYYPENTLTLQGIPGFAENKNIQLIIALPGQYSFLYGYNPRSITGALASNTGQPVLILK